MGFVTILLPGLVLGALLAYLTWGTLKLMPERLQPEEPIDVGIMLDGLVLIFAFVLGLTVVAETDTLGKASDAASKAANSVSELYWYAHALPDPEHSRLQGLLRDYASKEANKEWPMLGHHQTSPDARVAAETIREDVLSFEPANSKEDDIYNHELDEVANLFEGRRSLKAIATSSGIPPILIDGLIILAAVTLIAIPFAGSLEKLSHLVLFGAFAALTIATLFFIFDLNNPFSGTIAVGPDAFNSLFTGVFVHVP